MSADAEIPPDLADALAAPFDRLLSEPARLRLQAALCGMPHEAWMGFTALRQALRLSDGNLGAHLAMLVDAGYADAQRDESRRRAVTRYAATDAGRAAFDAHVRALEAVIASGRAPGA